MIFRETYLAGTAVVATDRLNRSLAALFDRQCSSFRKWHKRCRKSYSRKSVHSLRVEIRRLFALLALLEGVLPRKEKIPRHDLKCCLKRLSSLRDIQVLSETVGESLEHDPKLKTF